MLLGDPAVRKIYFVAKKWTSTTIHITENVATITLILENM